MADSVAEQFVLMYVNSLTLSMGENGIAALNCLFNRSYERGLIKQKPRLDILDC